MTDTPDIVERLREGAKEPLYWATEETLLEAADEIQRLRKQCETLAAEVDDLTPF